MSQKTANHSKILVRKSSNALCQNALPTMESTQTAKKTAMGLFNGPAGGANALKIERTSFLIEAPWMIERLTIQRTTAVTTQLSMTAGEYGNQKAKI
jgi:hypothetical protein